MAVPYLGDYVEDATVYMPFNTFSSDDPAASVTITNLAAADINVHKDGSTTEIVTDGATVIIDFDGNAGQHLLTIDTSAHADYATGSDYLVEVIGTTVDGATINAWIGQFSIENRAAKAAITTLSTKVDSDAVLVLADHDKTQSDIVIIDDFLDTEIAALTSNVLIIDNFLDTEMASQTSNLVIIASDTLAIEADTNELQVDNVPGLISTLSTKVDSDMTLVIADHDKTQSDIVLLSTKQDSDMTVVATAHTKTQSDIVIVDDFLDLEMAAQTSNLVIIASDTVAIEVDTNSLNDGAISELAQAAPSATPTLQNAVMLMYMALRNKLVVQTSGTDALELYDNSGTKIAKKLITDDGSDYTEDEMTSGA